MAEDSNDEFRYDLPSCLISDHMLPFVERSTWDNLIVANHEIHQGSRKCEAPWPLGEFGYEEDEENEEDDESTSHEEISQLCFSSDGKCLCALSDQRIRMWHNAVGSCGHIAAEVNNRFGDLSLWRVCFSAVENLLVSLHLDQSHVFRLWEVNAGGLVFKVVVTLDEVEDVFGCTFSQDGRQLILHCKDNALRICSVSDSSQLMKVVHLVGDSQERCFDFAGVTTDGCRVACVEVELSQTKHFRLWDVHGDGSVFEDVCACQEGECLFKIAVSPLDDSIAIVTDTGVIKLAHRRARDMTWVVETVADGKCFHTTGKMSFSTSGQWRGSNLGRNQVGVSPNNCLRSTLDAGIFP
jgi:WD40 repeat protein